MQAARHMLRRFGFIGVLLVLLGAVVQPASACAPDRDPVQAQIQTQILTQTLIVTDADPAGSCADDCRDCVLSCGHGCCHAHGVGVMTTASFSPTAVPFERAASWANVVGFPDGDPAGPDRPPRA
jgi:hypothetical protein